MLLQERTEKQGSLVTVKKLFTGGMTEDTMEHNLKHEFEEYGKYRKMYAIEKITDRESGKGKQKKKKEALDLLVLLIMILGVRLLQKYHTINGHYVEVKRLCWDRKCRKSNILKVEEETTLILEIILVC